MSCSGTMVYYFNSFHYFFYFFKITTIYIVKFYLFWNVVFVSTHHVVNANNFMA